MARHYEIIPGKSIGPFELGMTREQIEALNIHPRKDFDDGSGTHYPMVDISEDALRAARHPRPGVNVYYDSSNTCHKLQALFGYKPTPPIFTLYGHIVNGITDQEVASILHSVGAVVHFVYASVVSAGLRAAKWEASDDHIMAIQVTPK